jgi:hypothetical protein
MGRGAVRLALLGGTLWRSEGARGAPLHIRAGLDRPGTCAAGEASGGLTSGLHQGVRKRTPREFSQQDRGEAASPIRCASRRHAERSGAETGARRRRLRGGSGCPERNAGGKWVAGALSGDGARFFATTPRGCPISGGEWGPRLTRRRRTAPQWLPVAIGWRRMERMVTSSKGTSPWPKRVPVGTFAMASTTSMPWVTRPKTQ